TEKASEKSEAFFFLYAFEFLFLKLLINMKIVKNKREGINSLSVVIQIDEFKVLLSIEGRFA
ncbi:hypothetical protein, partial [Flavobacterium sp. SLB02]|uniref:hypothetical protein n=1 Tax=Flavobacterium sp. SLB02 TaxID=2665645 RepID=UPI001E2B593C